MRPVAGLQHHSWFETMHFNDRALEWYSALAMLVWGLTLAVSGQNLLADPNFMTFHEWSFMTARFWTIAFCVSGSVRISALVINGRLQLTTPVIRVAGAWFGFVSWAQLAVIVTEGTFVTRGLLVPATGIYALLALSELLSVFRAASDVRHPT